jgi:hypothetical protein
MTGRGIPKSKFDIQSKFDCGTHCGTSRVIGQAARVWPPYEEEVRIRHIHRGRVVSLLFEIRFLFNRRWTQIGADGKEVLKASSPWPSPPAIAGREGNVNLCSFTGYLRWLARVWCGRCGLVARVPQDRMQLRECHIEQTGWKVTSGNGRIRKLW